MAAKTSAVIKGIVGMILLILGLSLGDLLVVGLNFLILVIAAIRLLRDDSDRDTP